MTKIVSSIIVSLFAAAAFAGGSPNIGTASELTLTGTSIPEGMLEYTARFKIPFLQGDSPLTEGNNITVTLRGETSPIHVSGFAGAVWTPAAFAELSAGGRAGSGWNIKLFGGDCYGVGVSSADANGELTVSGKAFDGAQLKAQAGGALQFDLAAIFPGDWNHVVARSYHEINYKVYTAADAHESWYYFENDHGQNSNGAVYYSHYLIGYQMPVILDFVALLAESNLFLYDTPNREIYRDDKTQWIFSLVTNFGLSEKISLALLTQFRTRWNYTDDNWKDLYYRKRNIDGNDPTVLEFYRVVAAVTLKMTDGRRK